MRVITSPSLFVALLSVSAAVLWGTGSAIAETIPAERGTDWSQAGIPGGIPNRAAIHLKLDPGATSASVTTASSISSAMFWEHRDTIRYMKIP